MQVSESVVRNPFPVAAVLCLLLAALSPNAVASAAGGGGLIGTMVTDGGESLALFGAGGNSWVVKEGETLADGSRLREVRTDRIIIERGGRREEVLLFDPSGGVGSSGGGGGPAPLAAGGALPPALAGPGDLRRAPDIGGGMKARLQAREGRKAHGSEGVEKEED